MRAAIETHLGGTMETPGSWLPREIAVAAQPLIAPAASPATMYFWERI